MLKPIQTALLSGALLALTIHPAPAQMLEIIRQCQSSGGQIVDGKCQMPQRGGPRAGAPENNGRAGDNRDTRDNNGRNTNNSDQRDNNGRNTNNFDQRGNGQRNNAQRGNGRNNFDQNAFDRRYYGRYGNNPNNFDRDRQRFRAQQRWQERYPHDYVYADDPFYRDCRNDNEVGGAIVGAILGGLLGNAASNGQGGGTLAGIILGGVGGAAVAKNLGCEDRSYAYRTYYDGFERGRPNATYQWRNARSGDYGTLLVGDYYRDRDNYRCATYTQTIYVNGRPQVGRGHACRQDDGTWALVD
jgi:surface antigen